MSLDPVDPGRYELRNGRTAYYDDRNPRQIALLVETDDGVKYGRSFPIDSRGELFGAERVNYRIGDVIQLVTPTVTPYRQGAYIITSMDVPFTVEVAKLTKLWWIPTVNQLYTFDIRYHVAMGQRPYIPYPHVPTCPACARKGRGIAQSPLHLKNAPGGGPLYVCEYCRFCGNLD